MRRLVLLFSLATPPLFAQSLPELVDACRSAPLLKAAAETSARYRAQSEAAKNALYPTLDADFSGTYLREKPVVYLQGSFSGLPPGTTMQTQAEELYFGALTLTYPLFTGFAVTAGIEAAKIEAMRAALEAEEARRNLYLQLVRFYAEAVAMRQLVRADDEALKAMERSHEKAKGFYDQGLLAESELLRIEADRHAIGAALIRDNNRRETALLQLSYLSDTSVKSVTPLPPPKKTDPGALLRDALAKRPDLQVLKAQLNLAREQERTAESGCYPTVVLYGRLASQGDSMALDGDGYTNRDKSAAGFTVAYSLFDGFKTRYEREAARKAQLSAQWAITAYEKQIETEIRSSLLALQSLQNERDAAAARVKAETAYAAQIQGQFENQLADADLLSRAIASLAKARSERAIAEARLYAAYATLLLQVGPETFETSIQGTPQKE
jgi:outer membrane protein TolC